MPISLIVANSLTNQIGYKNELLCKLPNDLKNFKELTTGKTVIMGRKTYESIIEQLGHPLPDRVSIVLTRDYQYDPGNENTYVYNSFEDILYEYYELAECKTDIFVVGGEEIYTLFMPHADFIYETVIEHVFDQADAYFPKIKRPEWKIVRYEDCRADKKHAHDYSFVVRKRVQRSSLDKHLL